MFGGRICNSLHCINMLLNVVNQAKGQAPASSASNGPNPFLAASSASDRPNPFRPNGLLSIEYKFQASCMCGHYVAKPQQRLPTAVLPAWHLSEIEKMTQMHQRGKGCDVRTIQDDQIWCFMGDDGCDWQHEDRPTYVRPPWTWSAPGSNRARSMPNRARSMCNRSRSRSPTAGTARHLASIIQKLDTIEKVTVQLIARVDAHDRRWNSY